MRRPCAGEPGQPQRCRLRLRRRHRVQVCREQSPPVRSSSGVFRSSSLSCLSTFLHPRAHIRARALLLRCGQHGWCLRPPPRAMALSSPTLALPTAPRCSPSLLLALSRSLPRHLCTLPLDTTPAGRCSSAARRTMLWAASSQGTRPTFVCAGTTPVPSRSSRDAARGGTFAASGRHSAFVV